MFSKNLEKEIIFLARRTLNLSVRHQRLLLNYKPVNPFLYKCYDVIISLYKGGKLRGRIKCKGFDSLYKVLIYSVVGVSSFDSRFNPVSLEELWEITIKISIFENEKCILSVSE